jgi:HK97 gp10 family phage protein
MQAPSGLKVIGTKELYQSLKIIGTPQKEINAANREAAQEILQDARRLVPVRTGRLLRTLKIKATARQIAISAGNETSVPYANPIHWGWTEVSKSHKGTAATWQKKNIKPQPFMARALGYNRKEILANYYKQMEKLINSQMPEGPIK